MTASITTTSSTSSGTISSAGLGVTSLDVPSLVGSLVSAAITPKQTLLTSRQTADQTSISALGAITSALSTLQTSLDSLKAGGALNQLTAQSADTSLFTASATTSAVPGNYQVEVDQLAQANTTISGAFSSSTAIIGTGTISITAGGSTFSVSLDSSNDTLQGLANAINGSDSNTGVSASIVTGTDGAHLLLSATKTGVANAVSVASTSLISFTPGLSAKDAKIQVAGVSYQGSSNTITDAISGVTLNLVGAEVGTSTNLAITQDSSAAVTAVQSFVTNYNAALTLVNNDTAYNASSTTSSTTTNGPLLGDITIQSLAAQLEAIAGSAISGSNSGINSLSNIGISTNSDGTLTLDTSALNTALSQNTSAVQNLLSGSDGVGTQLNTLVNSYTNLSNGLINAEVTSFQNQLTDLSQQQTDLNQKSTDLTTLYTAQFNAINNIVSKYNNISSYLTQTFQPTVTSTGASTSSGG